MITPAYPPPARRPAYPNGQLSRSSDRANLMLMSRLNSGDQLTEDGDVLVLPSHPGEGFLAYVRRIDGSAEGEPLILVPLPGRRGAEWLCDDRLAAAEFVAGLRPFGGVAFPAGRGGELVDFLTARGPISRNRAPWPSFPGAHGSGGDLIEDALEDRVGDPAAGPVTVPADNQADNQADNRAADRVERRAADPAPAGV